MKSAIQLNPLTEEMAIEVCKWRYEGLYAVYNLSDWEVVVSNCWSLSSEDERSEYFQSLILDGEIIGFGRIQVIEGVSCLGIGIKPDECGKGYGTKSMALLIEEAKRREPDLPIGLEVRQFNSRAKKCYEKIGFVTQKQYMKETVEGFVSYFYMQLS
jgi:RimJ/RimL family protein N-acetyltransferase